MIARQDVLRRRGGLSLQIKAAHDRASQTTSAIQSLLHCKPARERTAETCMNLHLHLQQITPIAHHTPQRIKKNLHGAEVAVRISHGITMTPHSRPKTIARSNNKSQS